ncbi:ATP-binding protein [Loktanella sp. R86503]|uniref:hybrid sensor histidine kinase/response regulator n=1 Tax=Loktanella sp. R86503 TaxID=3093847 RepID=UPI0036DA56CD
MFLTIFQSLSGLVFAGTFLYVILMWPRLDTATRTQKALIGTAFGILAGSFETYGLPLAGAETGIKAGPFIFAAYLGGPVGAIAAAAVWHIFIVLFDGTLTGWGENLALGYLAIGLFSRFRTAFTIESDIPKSAFYQFIFGITVFHIISSFIQFAAEGSRASWIEWGQDVCVWTAAAAASVALTGLTVLFVQHLIRQLSSTTQMANRLRFALQQTKVGVFERMLDDYKGSVDEVFVSIYGLPPGTTTMTRSEWLSMIYPDDVPIVLAGMNDINSPDREQGIFDYRIVRPDGEIRHIRENWIAEFDRQGRKFCLIAIHTDLTDIRKAQRVHLESMARVALIADNLPGVVFQTDITDPDKPNIIYIGPKCLSLWGYTDLEIYDDNALLTAAHDPADHPVFLAALRQSVATATPFSHRYMITARDGQTRWVEFHGGPIFSNDRIMMEGIILDVTTEVQTMQQIEKEREISHRAQKLESIGQLTGGVAHDFNNLLAVIIGNLELLMDETDPAMHAELVNNAITAAMRGAELTKSMLSFARKARLMPVVLDLNVVVQDAQRWIGRTMPKSVVIETALSPDPWPVKADLSSLENALLNLILNARDAMQGTGKVTITTANVVVDAACEKIQQGELVPGRYVMMTVTDTGDGIAAENLTLIFEPFFTTKRYGEGSGLGLSMIVGFMKQSGGTIQVESRPYQGTTFRLYFPAAEQTDTAGHADPLENQMTDRTLARILVAEDEPAVGAAIVKMLERAGYHVTRAASGDEAYAIFSKDPRFDLLLTDIVMPGKLQGPQLAQKIRHKWPDVPVVFMSGYASEAQMNSGDDKADDIRLMKPVRRADLLAAVARALGQHPASAGHPFKERPPALD